MNIFDCFKSSWKMSIIMTIARLITKIPNMHVNLTLKFSDEKDKMDKSFTNSFICLLSKYKDQGVSMHEAFKIIIDDLETKRIHIDVLPKMVSKYWNSELIN